MYGATIFYLGQLQISFLFNYLILIHFHRLTELGSLLRHTGKQKVDTDHLKTL